MGSVHTSIVVPTYGNQAGIADTVSSLRGLLDQLGPGHEVLVIDDLSPDGTWPALLGAIGDDGRVRAYRLAKNVGQHRATRLGLTLARGARVVTMDDDLQHPVEEIPTLLAAMRDDLDVVYGVYKERQQGAWRRITSWAAYLTHRALLGLTRREPWQRTTTFRVLSRRIINRLRDAGAHGLMLDGWLHAHTARIDYVLVRHAPRAVGRSSYTLRKLIGVYLDLTFGYSTRPLAVVWTLGLLSSLLGLSFAAYLLVGVLTQGTVDAAAAAIAVGLLVGGGQLVGTAIVGQYVGRTFLQRALLDDDGGLVVERREPLASTADAVAAGLERS